MDNKTTTRVAIVTGASSGIGKAVACELVARGYQVGLLARRQDRLTKLKAEFGDRVLPIVCDVSRSNEVHAAVDEVIVNFQRLDVVVANAGISVLGRAANVPVEEFRRAFDTNVFGVVHVMRACIPELRRSGGMLGVVGSIAGYGLWPNATPYAMSKAAVRGLADCVRLEARGQFSVTHVAPGFVASEIRGERDPVPAWLVMPTAKAARRIVDGILNRNREVVFPMHGKIYRALERHTPWASRGLVALHRRVHR